MFGAFFCIATHQIGDGEEEDGGGAGGAHGMHGGSHGMHMDDDHDEHHGLDEASLKEHEEVTKVKVRYTLVTCKFKSLHFILRSSG